MKKNSSWAWNLGHCNLESSHRVVPKGEGVHGALLILWVAFVHIFGYHHPQTEHLWWRAPSWMLFVAEREKIFLWNSRNWMEKSPFWKLCRHEQLLPVSGWCQCLGDEAEMEEYLHVEMNGKTFCFICSYTFPCCIWECFSTLFFLYSAMIVWRNLFKVTVGKQSQFPTYLCNLYLTCISVSLSFYDKGMWVSPVFRPWSSAGNKTPSSSACSHMELPALHYTHSALSALEQM